MELFLLRHGLAEEKPTRPGRPDSDRALTDKGIRRLGDIARAMQEMDLSFDLVLSSPFRRARQTAEIVVECLKLQDRLQFSTHLAVPPSTPKLIEQLNATRPLPQSVLLVGHEPHLSELAVLLLMGQPGAELTLKKGGLCKLKAATLRAARCASLEWLLTPKQMCLMA